MWTSLSQWWILLWKQQKPDSISLSSCESELRSLVSAICDGMFIVACAKFLLGADVRHVAYSSARQLAMRQGCGKVRHLSGKILWIQQQIQDDAVQLKQIGAAWNTSDIGTKCLSKQRLTFLMHECGLVYLPSCEEVGTGEFNRQLERSANGRNIQRVVQALRRYGVALGLEPVVVAGQHCSSNSKLVSPLSQTKPWMTFLLVGLAMIVVFIALCKLVKRVRALEHDSFHMGNQLADHYDYDAQLDTRLSEAERTAIQLDMRIQENAEGLEVVDEGIDAVRYGLMLQGGFVPYRELTFEQRAHMMTTERANFVMWNMRQCPAEDTDNQWAQDEPEGGEEETPTSDVEQETENDQTSGMARLRDRLRGEINRCLREEQWRDASDLQSGVMSLIEAMGGRPPEGMSMRVMTNIHNMFQRLYRRARNSGRSENAQSYLRYVEDMNAMMR